MATKVPSVTVSDVNIEVVAPCDSVMIACYLSFIDDSYIT